ncbi:MAG: hypothetical protein KAJ31_03930 [Deltaproteobacteria bacterium]|nr:hypothetical protein [Deltaproteobacteria bacterium]MCK5710572.1 hypothetical protein [Deltaproteobacteria bacterium]
MFKSISVYLLIVLAISGFVSLSPAFSEDEDKTSLFTEDEAKQLRYSDKEWDKETIPKHEPDTLDHPTMTIEEPLVKDTDRGPEIVAITPANFFIVIKQNDSPLDPETLKVWGEKFFIHIDVTDRVLKYFKTTKDGAILHGKSIHIPKGHYKVGMSIKDINGKKTEKKYRLKVE